VLFRIAARTHDLAIGETELFGVLESHIRIGEVNDGLLQSLRRFQ
jgi:hypothetical protein